MDKNAFTLFLNEICGKVQGGDGYFDLMVGCGAAGQLERLLGEKFPPLSKADSIYKRAIGKMVEDRG